MALKGATLPRQLITENVVVPQFFYKGYDAKGMLVRDSLAAQSKDAALDQLSKMGLLVTQIQGSLFERSAGRKVRPSDFYFFNQELLALVKAGIPLADALQMCLVRPKSPHFASVLKQVHQCVLEGAAYSEATEVFPDVFDPIYVSSIKVSEQTGNLEKSLSQYLLYLSRKLEITAKIKQALYYPIFLLATLAVVMTILFVFVVPSFSSLYDGLGAELPAPTKMVLQIADVAPYILGAGALLALIGLAIWRSIAVPQRLVMWIDKSLNRLPIVGRIRLSTQQSRSLRMIDGLLSSGTPLVSALAITADSFPNSYLSSRLKRAAEHVEEGCDLSSALERESFLSEQHIRMIHVGENSGALVEMIASVASYLEERLEAQLKGLTSLFEPIVMLVLGVFTGAIIISMYLPIFFLAEVVQ